MQVKFELEKLFNKVTILAMICMIILTVFHGLISFGKWEETYVHKYKTVKGKLAYWSYLNVSKEYEGELNQEYLNRFTKDFQNSKERKAIESGKIYQWTKYSLARDFILPIVIDESISQNSKLDFNKENLKDVNSFYKKFKKEAITNMKLENKLIGFFKYTKNQLEIVENKINNIKTPITIKYTEGLKNFLIYYKTDYLLFCLVLVFGLSSLFSKDSNSGVDELSLSTKTGKGKNLNSRWIAGNVFILLGYGIYVLTLLITHGLIGSLHGLGASIQILEQTSAFNINIFQGILLVIFCGLLGGLVIGNLIMVISIYSKNMKFTILTTGVILFFMNNFMKTQNSFKQLLPLNFNNKMALLKSGNYFFIGDTAIPYFIIVFILSVIYILVFYTLTRVKFKRYYL
ncbi:hypothetical protein [Miniphocaeibacter halophilus]|uniref:Uncharacterized protein n=1 Tax=Miniphocaeibacter halophilus TaxID=2931922 RepID=A0AC61MRZ5_9FIRM|nr:hypothetical protein [Miniphocaeibacter halophilus]QQK08322.1 hypothetical protein JFY71_01915 [Miniphocaeibacter halophilus]